MNAIKFIEDKIKFWKEVQKKNNNNDEWIAGYIAAMREIQVLLTLLERSRREWENAIHKETNGK